MLIVAGCGLIFFIVASMGLCFGIVLKTVWMQWDVLVAAEQCSHRVKAFCASHTALPASRLGVHKKMGGDTAGTADPNCPKGCSIPYDIMLSSIKLGEEEGRGG